jgi:hypothetical protein
MIEGQVVWAEDQDAGKATELFMHGVRFTSPSWSVSLALGLLLAEPH